MTTKHHHAEWIKLFVDGVPIEFRRYDGGPWAAVTLLNHFDIGAQFIQFRRAPERKKYRVAKMRIGEWIYTTTVDSERHALGLERDWAFGGWITDWVEYE